VSLSDLSDPAAVRQALEEFDRLGRDEFLAKYGFGKSRRYLLVEDGRRYDAKAIAGAAHGYQHPDKGPLKQSDFTSGLHTVVPRLQSLGFEIEDLDRGEPTSGPDHRAYIFQANPTYYDIDAAVSSLREMNWTVKQHSSRVHKGDRVYIWRSGEERGVIAVGTVLTEPAMLPDQEGQQFIRDREMFEGEQLRVRLSIDRVLDPPLLAPELTSHRDLKDLRILRLANNTNYNLTPPQEAALAELTGMPQVGEIGGEPYREPKRSEVEAALQSAGMTIDERTLQRYRFSLKSGGFVILCGLSGCGKTWLAELYAEAIGARHLLVSVAPNWTSNEDLLGYLNPLNDTFQHTGLSRFLEAAATEWRSSQAEEREPRPFHVTLDEMNLARVEHYFARFLSGLEVRGRKGSAMLELAPGKTIEVTPNLRFTGTVNVDETTHGFADKVYDRAQLLELRVAKEAIEGHLDGLPYKEVLVGIWEATGDVAPFAFRVVDEIKEYVEFSEQEREGWEEPLDEQILQKVLPKVRGADQRTGPALEKLIELAGETLPLTRAKATTMHESFQQYGFASYH
jgi:energy-coupling factor transporter ATP-binding protein EcfA2